MHASGVRLAKAMQYVPSIKFVGGRHPIVAHAESALHPCTVDSLRPGSAECSSINEIVGKWIPFQVVPYKNPQASKAASAESSKYAFSDRPLQENEVASISQLPARFKMRPMDDIEIDAINNGGVL